MRWGWWLLFVSACNANSSSHCTDALGTACPVLTKGIFAQRLAIDSTTLYWTEILPGRIRAISKNGGSTRDVLTTETPRAIAVDESGLFFSVIGSEATGYTDGTIDSIDKSGGLPTVVAMVGQDPIWVALDATTVYAATGIANVESPSGVPTGLFSAPRAGGSVTQLVIGPTGPVAADASGVYWAGPSPWGGSTSGVFALPAGASTAVMLASDANVGALVIDDINVYFVAFVGVANSMMQTSVITVPKSGGASTVLFTGDYVRTIAVDGANIYALQMGDADVPTGRILSIPKTGGSPQVFASQLSYPTDLVMDAAYVYCADFNAGAIVKLAK